MRRFSFFLLSVSISVSILDSDGTNFQDVFERFQKRIAKDCENKQARSIFETNELVISSRKCEEFCCQNQITSKQFYGYGSYEFELQPMQNLISIFRYPWRTVMF